MTARIHARITRAELAAIVCEALVEALEDSPILVGGGAATIYSNGEYLSDDLDIVTYRDRKRIAPVMQGLGFEAQGAYWVHRKTPLFVQFVAPPPMIGNKYIREPTLLKTKAGTLRCISPLDAACDRLAWYLQGDAPSLDQAAAVVRARQISISKIRAWLANEDWPDVDKERALEALRERLRSLPKK